MTFCVSKMFFFFYLQQLHGLIRQYNFKFILFHSQMEPYQQALTTNRCPTKVEEKQKERGEIKNEMQGLLKRIKMTQKIILIQA